MRIAFNYKNEIMIKDNVNEFKKLSNDSYNCGGGDSSWKCKQRNNYECLSIYSGFYKLIDYS